MDWTRRDVLRAIGVGTAAPALAPLLQACGGHSGVRVMQPATTARPIRSIRPQLRDAIETLARSYEQPSALASIHTRGGAAYDGTGRGANRETTAGLVLGVTSGGLRYEQATTDLSSDGIARAVDALSQRAPKSKAAKPIEIAAPRDHAVTLETDPASLKPLQWLERIETLFGRARRVGGSRIVYRGAYVTVADVETLFIGEAMDALQRIVRTRAGVLFVAWTGAAATADEAVSGGTIGMEALMFADDELEAAADRALSLLTARPAPSGEMDVILDPTLAGLIAEHVLVPAMDSVRWQARASRAAAGSMLGSALLTLIDDPTLEKGFGSYYFDDDGTPAQRTTLIDAGQVKTPLTDAWTATSLKLQPSANGRRATATESVRPRPSNLTIAGGTATLEELIGRVKQGVLMEGGRMARTDPRTWSCVARAARARHIVNGKLTGALFGTIDLRATAPELLTIRGATRDVVSHPVTRDGLAMSFGGPYLLTRARVSRG